MVFSYFGQAYHGWQKQPNARSVQEVLEEAFVTLLRQPIALVGAGRTDAGVHAREMVAHFDFSDDIFPEKLVFRLNALLPKDIAVYRIVMVSNETHARFDAVSRTYEYWITQYKNPFYMNTAHYVKHPLKIKEMNKGAQLLQKFEDFECFSKSNTDVKTYLCKISYANWEEKENKLVFTITADRFLRNMVRAVVGTLLDIGIGKTSLEDLTRIIESKNRSKAGASVPAKGLYLTKVLYPNNIFK